MCRQILRFDGAYRTSSPIIVDTPYGESLSLSLRFQPDSVVEYECRVDDDEESGKATYEWIGSDKVQFSFDARWWETEWEGTPDTGQLRLTFRMEGYGGGPAASLKCVAEGEVTLRFVLTEHESKSN